MSEQVEHGPEAEQLELDACCDVLRTGRFFRSGARVIVARAPGRLDVMGGIADYSGSLVLQRPIAEATFVAVQPLERPVVEIVSLPRRSCTIPLAALAPQGQPLGYGEARRGFADPGEGPHPAPRWPYWASYVVGPILVLARERGMPLSGLRLVVQSQVPEGKGVSSSAAIETATMHAAATAFHVPVTPHDLALLSQRSENLISGAPCGVMDQMTCVFGVRDQLMALLCQPATLQPMVRIPEDIAFWGLDSGERHAVGGSDYGSVRTAAFMGLRMLTADQPESSAYLADIAPADFERELGQTLPKQMTGAEFLARYGHHLDTVTRVQPDQVYRVKSATAHPIYERHRAERFRQLLLEPPDEERRVRLGALLDESHASYQACELASPGTNCLVELTRREGAVAGLYGARITGGGSGGTVAVIGRRDAGPAIARVAAAYARITGHRPHVFAGSSRGIAAFGAVAVTL